MPAEPRTLPTGPLPHPAMDYAQLRAEGLRLLAQLAGEQWTDFNTHDPGVTILEQLCYAITDLGYRCNYPMADLLAGVADPGLPGPAEILTGDPVTLADLRRLALDDPRVLNAWVGPPAEAKPAFYWHESMRQLCLVPDQQSPCASQVELSGPLRVTILVDTADQANKDKAQDVLQDVTRRLHAARPLGTDFELALAERYPVKVTASIEIAESDNPIAVLTDILERLDDCLAPRPRFQTVTQALAEGRPLDEALEGPLLQYGLIESLAEPPGTLYASDLIRAIAEVPQVRVVTAIEPTFVLIPPGQIAALGEDPCLTLLRDGRDIHANLADARKQVVKRRRASLRDTGLSVVEPSRGRDRALARYRSVRRQLPECYGVGPFGLPASAPPQRRAQAQQLAAYLSIFDQLLANQFAQLANAGALLSPGANSTDDNRSYFAQPVDDPPLDTLSLLGATPDTLSRDGYRAWLDREVDPEIDKTDNKDNKRKEAERRGRFLAHLLARFGEDLGSTPLAPDLPDLPGLLDRRREFLRRYPRLSGARGSGRDLYAGSESGFLERLRLKLGMKDPADLELVEYILLRPVPEDSAQSGDGCAVPLLADADGPDPWSLRIGIVFKTPDPMPDPPGQAALETFVGETILAEAPAHLAVYVHWLDSETWSTFKHAWCDFLTALHAYRWPPPSSDTRQNQLRFRAARDRLIELLGIGRPYPLRDLLPQSSVSVSNGQAQVTLPFSQEGFLYMIMAPPQGAGPPKDPPPVIPAGQGTPGGAANLSLTVAGTDGETYLVAAQRIEEGNDPRRTWLCAPATGA